MYQISNHDPRSHISIIVQFVNSKLQFFQFLLPLFAHLQKQALFSHQDKATLVSKNSPSTAYFQILTKQIFFNNMAQNSNFKVNEHFFKSANSGNFSNSRTKTIKGISRQRKYFFLQKFYNVSKFQIFKVKTIQKTFPDKPINNHGKFHE